MSFSFSTPAQECELPLAALRTAELFVVTSARLWLAPQEAPDEPHADWRLGFRAAAISDDGGRAFDTLLAILVETALQPIEIRAPRAAMLSRDEARLLRLLQSLQGERLDTASALLGVWLPPAAARHALPVALAFARSLGESRLWLPQQPDTRSIHVHDAAVYANRGLTLVQ